MLKPAASDAAAATFLSYCGSGFAITARINGLLAIAMKCRYGSLGILYLLYDYTHAGRRKCMADVVSSDYVRARWAYSELLSVGHGHLYLGEGVPELREKVRQKVPFGELGKAEHYLLVDQFDRVRGRYLNRYLIGIASFQLVRWTRDNLAAVHVIPYFVRDVSSLEYLKVTFKQWIEAEPVRPLHQDHARYAAYGAAPPTQDDPLAVGKYSDLPALLDGYHRAVQFWSRNDPDATLPVYVPFEAKEALHLSDLF